MKTEKYTEIFVKKEFNSIVGRGWRNFWILSAVFLVTIFALEFSRSGIYFLDYKMNDPFIKWINVRYQTNFDEFRIDTDTDSLKMKYNISTVEENMFMWVYAFTSEFGIKGVDGRTISYESELVKGILGDKNIVKKREMEMNERDYGWIVTKDLMERLGYDDKDIYPLYINFASPGDTTRLKETGLKNFKTYFEVPIPIIAVVEQLPDLLDFIAPTYFMEQFQSRKKPFIIPNKENENYFYDLYLVAENPDENIVDRIKSYFDDAGIQYDDDIDQKELSHLLRHATQYGFTIRDTVYQTLNSVVSAICEKEKDLYRTYRWNFDPVAKLSSRDYLSFMFNDLTKVKEFSNWAKETHGIRIDMAQIEAKENFKTFSLLSSMLCFFIAVIAIAFVAIFLYFLIDSHFRRISKNLGTIMAFGLGNKQIIRIYLAVFLLMILVSLLAVVGVLGGAEILFNTLEWWQYENGMPHFSLGDKWVILTILVIPVISAVATVVFLRFKLKATPGDLIFERN